MPASPLRSCACPEAACSPSGSRPSEPPGARSSRPSTRSRNASAAAGAAGDAHRGEVEVDVGQHVAEPVGRDGAVADDEPQRGDAVLQVGGDRLLGDGDVGVGVPLTDVPAAGYAARPEAAGRRRAGRAGAAHEGRQAGHADRRRQVRGVRGGVERGDGDARGHRAAQRLLDRLGQVLAAGLAQDAGDQLAPLVAGDAGEAGGQPEVLGDLVLAGDLRVGRRRRRVAAVLVGGTHPRWDSSSARLAAVSPGRARPVRPGGCGPTPRGGRVGLQRVQRGPGQQPDADRRAPARPRRRCRGAGRAAAPPPWVPRRARAIGSRSAYQPKSSPPMLCGDSTTPSAPTVSSAAERSRATERGSLTTGGTPRT